MVTSEVTLTGEQDGCALVCSKMLSRRPDFISSLRQGITNPGIIPVPLPRFHHLTFQARANPTRRRVIPCLTTLYNQIARDRKARRTCPKSAVIRRQLTQRRTLLSVVRTTPWRTLPVTSMLMELQRHCSLDMTGLKNGSGTSWANQPGRNECFFDARGFINAGNGHKVVGAAHTFPRGADSSCFIPDGPVTIPHPPVVARDP